MYTYKKKEKEKEKWIKRNLLVKQWRGQWGNLKERGVSHLRASKRAKEIDNGYIK